MRASRGWAAPFLAGNWRVSVFVAKQNISLHPCDSGILGMVSGLSRSRAVGKLGPQRRVLPWWP